MIPKVVYEPNMIPVPMGYVAVPMMVQNSNMNYNYNNNNYQNVYQLQPQPQLQNHNHSKNCSNSNNYYYFPNNIQFPSKNVNNCALPPISSLVPMNLNNNGKVLYNDVRSVPMLRVPPSPTSSVDSTPIDCPVNLSVHDPIKKEPDKGTISETDYKTMVTNRKIPEKKTRDGADEDRVVSIERYLRPEVRQKKQCPVCGKKCSRPSTLKTHYLIHTGDNPFNCTWDSCEKSFNVKSNLQRHIKSHERKLVKRSAQMHR